MCPLGSWCRDAVRLEGFPAEEPWNSKFIPPCRKTVGNSLIDIYLYISIDIYTLIDILILSQPPPFGMEVLKLAIES